ncbi:hypothetical protein GOP47_0003716 [Adiantum capillus-veneris]|uniref:Beta-galactosidase n=1 Tax=Adiantum capillus-veneris TaxID=13818 RepID=A0A9D4V6G9_ADICA|nr:hypothetical protein GOP47_0003716 [Adiantum capillus-veneris]
MAAGKAAWPLAMMIFIVLLTTVPTGSCTNSTLVLGGLQRSVTYDERAIVIDGQRKLLISASIHYPRSTPEMWPDLIAKAKEGGVDVIESYMFWNMHEPQRGMYVFNGRLDLVRFIKEAEKAGLYFHLRIGPYACAEWNYGGFPAWLHFLPGIRFRTDNPVFKGEMERITRKIVDILKQEKLFYWQGGPVILAQIENEYGNIYKPYGPAGKRYLHWTAQMAEGLNTQVPWVMCQQKDAPDPIINTCNGFYCDHFKPNSHKKPKMWTENWTGWFLAFGGLQPHRPAEDVAFAVARFFQTGGTFQNYYMYHGGTNFERTAGGPFIATSYDYDAPLDEYGLLQQPKWGHLKDLHEILRLCEKPLLHGEVQKLSWGRGREGAVYTTADNQCCAFLSNKDQKKDAEISFNSGTYHIPAWSVSILPDCKNVSFNTAQVNHQTTRMNMKTVKQEHVVPYHATKHTPFVWETYKEPIGAWGSNAFTRVGLKDQMNTTRDTTDYMWYTTSLYSNSSSGVGRLVIRSLGDNMLIFLNGELIGNGYGNYDDPNFQLQLPLTLKEGKNALALLSTTVGLKTYGSFFDITGTGIDGPMSLVWEGKKVDLTRKEWTYQIGLLGEKLELYSEKNNLSTNWASDETHSTYQPMTWYKTIFNAPPGNDPVAVDLWSMGKGAAWVNGHGLGRYWSNFLSSNLGCERTCNYRGVYRPAKCAQNCGQASQRWFHIPRSWLKPSGNIFVLLEEIGGDPTQISFVTRVPETICTFASEKYSMLKTTNGTLQMPMMRLKCGPNQKISSIQFASYGNPQGSCQSFKHGNCHANRTADIVEQACAGKQQCSLSTTNMGLLVGEDPCPGQPKSLAVQAVCT